MKQDTSPEAQLPGNSQNATQMVSLAKFAELMSICPNTVRNWIADGKLLAGTHYLHVGRVYRFAWGDSFVEKLMQSLTPQAVNPRPQLMSRQNNRTHLNFRA